MCPCGGRVRRSIDSHPRYICVCVYVLFCLSATFRVADPKGSLVVCNPKDFLNLQVKPSKPCARWPKCIYRSEARAKHQMHTQQFAKRQHGRTVVDRSLTCKLNSHGFANLLALMACIPGRPTSFHVFLPSRLLFLHVYMIPARVFFFASATMHCV